jgi:hypothetical protein
MSLLALLIVAVPVGLYFGAFLVLGVWNLFAPESAQARVSFYCPFSKRQVAVDFLTESGAGQPSDVLCCSAFPRPDQVRCKKDCLALAESRWVSTPMLPRFSLIAGGTAYRPTARDAAAVTRSPETTAA